MPQTSVRQIAAFALSIALLLTCPQTLAARATSHLFQHNGRSLEVIISGNSNAAAQKRAINWADYISKALLQVYGRWPRKNWQISVSPVSIHSNDPIPWAQVHRGDPDRVAFYTASDASYEELISAWTSYHELSHLLIPYRGWGDIWFSEGLASYYQNILQARVGLFTEQQMWQRLYEGFARGRAQSEFEQMDLQSLSDHLQEKRAFMRVYWSGAWYFLSADIELRLESNGTFSLDDALEKLNHCCAEDKMSVLEMVKKLDELNNLTLFYPLYLRLTRSTRMPSYEPLFARIGIMITDKKVRLEATGSNARLRARIAARKSL